MTEGKQSKTRSHTESFEVRMTFSKWRASNFKELCKTANCLAIAATCREKCQKYCLTKHIIDVYLACCKIANQKENKLTKK